MTYAVAGVSGNTGKVAASLLLDQGHQVRAIVRDAAKGKGLAARGAEVAVADLSDAAALEKAFAGVKGAFVLVPPNLRSDAFRAYQRGIVDAVARAAERAGLPHLVLLSSIGAQLPSGTGPIAGIHEAEARFRALPATKSTFVRAGYFMENLAASLGTLEQGFIPWFLPAARKLDMIATVDIGKTVAGALAEGATSTTAIELGGPAHSAEDVVAILSDLTGRPIRVQEAPVAAVSPTFQQFGMSADMANLFQEMLAGFGEGRIGWEGGHRRVQGTTTLRTVLSQLLGK